VNQQRQLDDVDWWVQEDGHRDFMHLVSTEVGGIQFLRSGYSIEIVSTDFVTNGVVLVGYIGNPCRLTISDLTLTFTAYEPFEGEREAYLKRRHHDSSDILSGTRFVAGKDIGKGQTLIAKVRPGQRVSFKVTIPNVKSLEDIELGLEFSGERYSYPVAQISRCSPSRNPTNVSALRLRPRCRKQIINLS